MHNLINICSNALYSLSISKKKALESIFDMVLGLPEIAAILNFWSNMNFVEDKPMNSAEKFVSYQLIHEFSLHVSTLN